MRFRKAFNSSLLTFGVVACHFLAYFPFARFGVDPHHDGVMLHPALMVAEGFSVHRDVYSQYGPLTTWIQAIFVEVLGPSLWSIRIATCVFLAVANGILFSLARRLYGLGLAFLATSISLCVAYFYSPQTTMHPWASDLMLLLIAACASMMHSAFSAKSQGMARIWFGLAGLVAGVTPFARQSVGLVLIATVFLVSWIHSKKHGLMALLGIGIAIVGILVYLRTTGALLAFWDQAVRGPIKWAIDERGKGGWSSVRGNLVNVAVIGSLVVVGLALWTRWICETWQQSSWSTRTKYLALASVVIMFVLAQNDGSLPFVTRESILWILFALGMVNVFLQFRPDNLNGSIRLSTLTVTPLVLVCSSVSIFPVTDVRHAYWAFLPMVAPALHLLSNLLVNLRIRVVAASVLLSLLGFQTMEQVQESTRIPRESILGIPVLKHMLFDSSYFRFFEPRFRTVTSYLRAHPESFVFNICSDGLFSSIGPIRKLPDPYFVSWNFGIDFFSEDSEVGRRRLQFIESERPIVWMCPLVEDPNKLADLYKLRLVPIDSSVPSDQPQYTWWPFVSYLGIPQEWTRLESSGGSM